MSTQCRKIARRRARFIEEPTGHETITVYSSGKRLPLEVTTYHFTPMNKQQRIIAGLVAEQHIKDRRFAQVRAARRDQRLLSLSAHRKKRHRRGKKRRAA